MAHSGRRVWLAVLLGVAMLASSARADVEVGETITKANADKVKDLVSPGLLWCINHGMALNIVPYKKIEWNKAFRQATEKYSSHVKVAADGPSIQAHVAELPIPKSVTNDR